MGGSGISHDNHDSISLYINQVEVIQISDKVSHVLTIIVAVMFVVMVSTSWLWSRIVCGILAVTLLTLAIAKIVRRK